MPKTPKSKTSKPAKLSLTSLNKLNLIAAGLLAAQAVALLVLASARSLPVTTSYLAMDTLASKAGKPVLVSASRNLFDVNVAYLVAAFLLVSAVVHLLVATRYRTGYEKDLAKGVNKWRWINYSFSVSLMMVVVAMFSGVYDLSSLLMIFALVATGSWLGLLAETHGQNTKQTSWLSYILARKAALVPWLVVVIYIWGARAYGAGLPAFVYWIYLSMFVCLGLLGVNTYLRCKKIGKWADPLYAERAYLVIGFVAQTLLAWQIFFGALRP